MGLVLVVSWGEGDRVLYNVRISIPRLVKTHFTKSKLLPSSGSVGYMIHNARNRLACFGSRFLRNYVGDKDMI